MSFPSGSNNKYGGFRPQFFLKLLRSLGSYPLGYLALRVIQIAKDSGLAHTPLNTRRQFSLLDPMNAERALLCHARPVFIIDALLIWRQIVPKVSIPIPAEISGSIGTCLDTVLASHAFVAIHQDDAILPFVTGLRGTDLDTRGFSAVGTLNRKKDSFYVRVFTELLILHDIPEYSRPGAVFYLAREGASHAADASFQVYD